MKILAKDIDGLVTCIPVTMLFLKFAVREDDDQRLEGVCCM